MASQETADLIYGRNPVRESLDARRVAKVLFASGAGGGPINELVALAKAQHVPFVWVERRKLDMMVGEYHQGVVAYVKPKEMASLKTVIDAALKSKSKGAGLVFLDGITDPQNLGAIIRSAYYFGVAGVVIPKWRAASMTGAVMRASAGAAHLIHICQVANLASAMEEAKDRGLWMVGAAMDGENAKTVDLPRPFALVMGSEGEGLHQLVRKKCDVVVSIQRGASGSTVDSLNVSAACAVLLHQFS
jgi:23S rRNA (guanosine2251-2'-O)-methyltransferase